MFILFSKQVSQVQSEYQEKVRICSTADRSSDVAEAKLLHRNVVLWPQCGTLPEAPHRPSVFTEWAWLPHRPLTSSFISSEAILLPATRARPWSQRALPGARLPAGPRAHFQTSRVTEHAPPGSRRTRRDTPNVCEGKVSEKSQKADIRSPREVRYVNINIDQRDILTHVVLLLSFEELRMDEIYMNIPQLFM